MAVHDEDEAFFEGIERSKKDLSVHWHKCKVKSLCIFQTGAVMKWGRGLLSV
jgi:hypothetical protein